MSNKQQLVEYADWLKKLLSECPWPSVCLCFCGWGETNRVSITVLLTGTIDPRPNTHSRKEAEHKKTHRWVVKTVLKRRWSRLNTWTMDTRAYTLCISEWIDNVRFWKKLVMIFTKHNTANWALQATVYLQTPSKIWAWHAVSVWAKTKSQWCEGKEFFTTNTKCNFPQTTQQTQRLQCVYINVWQWDLLWLEEKVCCMMCKNDVYVRFWTRLVEGQIKQCMLPYFVASSWRLRSDAILPTLERVHFICATAKKQSQVNPKIISPIIYTVSHSNLWLN